jgi:hypothetical protein
MAQFSSSVGAVYDRAYRMHFLPSDLRFLFGLDFAFEFFAMAQDDVIELLLDFTQEPRRVNAGKVAIDVLIDDFDKREKLSNGQIGLHFVKTRVQVYYGTMVLERCL